MDCSLLGPRLLCPWNFPGNSTGVGCHSLLQGIFLTQGCNTGLPQCRQTLDRVSHWGSTRSQTTVGELEADCIQRLAKCTWPSQGPVWSPWATPSRPLWPRHMYPHPRTPACTPLKIPDSGPGSGSLGRWGCCPVFRLGPWDCPLHPTPGGEFADGSVGLEPTVFTGGDVAALPVGGPRSPGAQVVGHCLVGAGVHALHAPGLETVAAAGRRAQGPQADPPVYVAGF